MKNELSLQEQLAACVPRSHRLSERRCLTILYLAHSRRSPIALYRKKGVATSEIPARRAEFDAFDAALSSGELLRIAKDMGTTQTPPATVYIPPTVAHADIEAWLKDNHAAVSVHFSLNYRWRDELPLRDIQ